MFNLKRMALCATMTMAAAMFAGEITISFDKDEATPSTFKKDHQWKIQGDDEIGTATVVESPDHAFGGKALKITKIKEMENPGYFRVVTNKHYPIKPGIKQRVSGWFKGDTTGVAQIQIFTKWQKDGKRQWYNIKQFKVTPEWKQQTFEFDVPEPSDANNLEIGEFELKFGIIQKGLTDLYIKDIVWEY